MGFDIDDQINIFLHMCTIISDLAHMIYSLYGVLVDVPYTIPLANCFSQSIYFGE